MSNTKSSIVDINKISKLGETQLTPEEIVKSLSQAYSKVKGINPRQTSRMPMAVYYQAGILKFSVRTGNDDIRYTISKSSINNTYSISNISVASNVLVDINNIPVVDEDGRYVIIENQPTPSLPNVGLWYDLFNATSHHVTSPIIISAISNVNNDLPDFTGGWHLKTDNSITSELVSIALIIDGVDRTNDTVVSLATVNRIEFEIVNNIMGYNTRYDNRYILQETIRYIIVNGIIELEVQLRALEDLVIENYHGLELLVNGTGWNETILFRDCDSKLVDFMDDIFSNDRYDGIVERVSQYGDYQLDSWIDSGVDLGRRDYVADDRPTVFTSYDNMKLYYNLVDGVDLEMTTNDVVSWRGGLKLKPIR